MIKLNAIYIFYVISISVLLIQCALGKPIDDNTPFKIFEDKKLHLTGANFTEYYANRTVNVTRQILHDPIVIANHNKEVEDFKLNLTSILNNYDEQIKAEVNGEIKNSTASEKAYNNIVQHFYNMTEYYFELPENTSTQDTKFIVDILRKYGGYEIYFELNTLAQALGHIIARVLEKVLIEWMKPDV